MVRVQADPTEYKVAARVLRPIAGSPRFVVDRCRKPIPAWARLAPCSRPSTPLRALRWPSASVDRRCARRLLVLRPGRRNGPQPNKETSSRGRGGRRRIPLDRNRPIQGAIPECAAGIHRGGGADGLALAGALHHGSLPLHAPGFAMHGIGTKPGLIPKPDLAASGAGLPSNGGEPLTPPVLDRIGIPLIGPLQRLLLRQSQLGEQRADR